MTYNIAPTGDTTTELYDPAKRYDAPQNAQLVYNGGPLLANVEVFTIFYGDWWNTQTSLLNHINAFFDDILSSEVIEQLTEYSVDTITIGQGKRTGTVTISGNAQTLDDSTIQSLLNDWIQQQHIPQPTANTLYFLYLPQDVSVTQSGDSSCTAFCGYHSNQGQVYYAVMPYPSCSGCQGELSTVDALLATSTHELCEAITDPVPGTGWYDNANGEIGDICAWNFKTINTINGTYTVQQEWSNANNACM